MKSEFTFDRLLTEVFKVKKNEIDKDVVRVKIIDFLTENNINTLCVVFNSELIKLPVAVMDLDYIIKGKNSSDLEFSYLTIANEQFINFYEAYEKYSKDLFDIYDSLESYGGMEISRDMFDEMKVTLAYLISCR